MWINFREICNCECIITFIPWILRSTVLPPRFSSDTTTYSRNNTRSRNETDVALKYYHRKSAQRVALSLLDNPRMSYAEENRRCGWWREYANLFIPLHLFHFSLMAFAIETPYHPLLFIINCLSSVLYLRLDLFV